MPHHIDYDDDYDNDNDNDNDSDLCSPVDEGSHVASV